MKQIHSKLDQLEKLVRSGGGKKRGPAKGSKRTPGMSATDTVYDVINASDKGVGVSDIQKKTGFDEKKLRNIIFRLNKLGKIKRVGRGLYKTV